MKKLKIVFASNFMNHHQLTVSDEFNKVSDYHFIATESVPGDRLSLGYKDMNKMCDYIVRSYESEDEMKKALELIDKADVVIFGSAPFEMVEQRIIDNKLTFRYSERLFKNKKLIRMFHPRVIKSVRSTCTKYKDRDYYLLCASAYSKDDYGWFGAFKNKTFKWGYFPKIDEIKDINKCIKNKMKSNTILWCGRFIDWKHPEYAIDCAKFLVKKGIDFKMKMVGTGPLLDKIKNKVKKCGLDGRVEVVGSLPFDQVQEEMKNSKVFLFTSDQNEGWGAVLNESMGNACCVIANEKIGSVPYIVEDGINGYTYKTKKEFLNKVNIALLNEKTSVNICKEAYNAIHSNWIPSVAVSNFMDLVKMIKAGKVSEIKSNNRPCTKA